MFTKLNEAEVSSDAGFSLRAGCKDYWIYSEGNRQIYITREAAHFGRAGYGEYVYLSCLPDCWLPPANIYAISEAKSKQIRLNVREALQFLGVAFKVV